MSPLLRTWAIGTWKQNLGRHRTVYTQMQLRCVHSHSCFSGQTQALAPEMSGLGVPIFALGKHATFGAVPLRSPSNCEISSDTCQRKSCATLLAFGSPAARPRIRF